MSDSSYLYDVFISYSPADRQWVNERLLPRLEKAGLRVAIDYRDFTVGMPKIENVEEVVEASRRAILVLTPAWLDSEWNGFEALLLRTSDPAARRRKLLPLLLEPCEPPSMIATLVTADLTGRRDREKELDRLTRDILDVTPPPPRPESDLGTLQWGWRWARYHRRALRRGVAGLFGLWLLVSLAAQLPPFHPRTVWASLDVRAPGATHLAGSADTLLLGGNNTERRCDTAERGLWQSPDGGQSWQAVHAPLSFQDPDRGCLLADVVGFATAATNPERVYAATSDVGLLFSDDAGRTWQRSGTDGLGSRRLRAVATAPAGRVFVAAEEGGLYRSDDGGERWQRLDRREERASCAHGQPLTRTLSVGALLATTEHLIVGTGEHFTEAHVPSGLYASDDGGTCWHQLDDGGRRDEYRALVAATARSVLILVRDWGKEQDENPFGVWRVEVKNPDLWSGLFPVTTEPAQRELLWEYHRTVAALATDGDRWYAATPLGKVMQGRVDAPAGVNELPRLLFCFVLVCDVDLMTKPDAAPLLLAGGRVFRLERGPWWHRLWP